MTEIDIENFMNQKSVAVKTTAQLLGKSEQFVRIGLRTKRLPIGSAVLLSSQWCYHISPRLLLEYMGLIKPEYFEEDHTIDCLSIIGNKIYNLHGKEML